MALRALPLVATYIIVGGYRYWLSLKSSYKFGRKQTLLGAKAQQVRWLTIIDVGQSVCNGYSAAVKEEINGTEKYSVADMTASALVSCYSQ